MRPCNLSDKELIHAALLINESNPYIIEFVQELAVRFENALRGEHTTCPENRQLEFDFS